MPENLFQNKKAYIIFLWSLAVLSLVTFVNEAVFNTLLSSQVDFRTYYNAALRLAEGGNPFQGEGLPYMYPLQFLWLIIPLSRLSYSSASGIWFAANLVMYLSVIALFGRRLLLKYKGQTRMTGLLLLAITFLMFSPGTVSILYGQVGILILFLLAFGYEMFRLSEESESAAGKLVFETLAAFLLCATVFIRISPVIIVLYFFCIHRKRPAFLMILWGIVLELISIYIHGFELNFQIVTHILSHMMKHGVNISFMQVLLGLGMPEMTARIVFMVYALALLLITIYLLYRYGRGSTGTSFSLFLVLITCIQPYLEIHHLTPLLVPFGIFLVERLDNAGRKEWLLMAGAWLIPAVIYQLTTESFLKGNTFVYCLPFLSIMALFALFAMEMKKVNGWHPQA